jgi:hypothetical protein
VTAGYCCDPLYRACSGQRTDSSDVTVPGVPRVSRPALTAVLQIVTARLGAPMVIWVDTVFRDHTPQADAARRRLAAFQRYRKFTSVGHPVTVAWAWWCLAGALSVLSAALFRRQVTILSVANPTALLPWIGWPTNTPRSARAFGVLAVFAMVFAMNCVVEALNRRHIYDVLWAAPFCIMIVIMTAVAQAQHNRRVRRGTYAGRKS